MSADDLVVSFVDGVTSAERVLVRNVDYSVQPEGYSETGYSVTLTAAPSADDLLVIQRDTRIQQPWASPADALGFERALDRLSMVQRELDEQLAAIRSQIGADGAGLTQVALTFDSANGEAIARLEADIPARVLTVSETITPDPRARFYSVEVIGGGGAGGGATTASANHVGAGDGGQAGGYARRIRQPLAGITQIEVIIGAGGQGVIGQAGGAGGASAVDDGVNPTVVAWGGIGGVLIGPVFDIVSAHGSIDTNAGPPVGGDLNVAGEAGGAAFVDGGATVANVRDALGGRGGHSPFGRAGRGGQVRPGLVFTAAGNAATGHGAGGGGGAAFNDAAAARAIEGGGGAPGLVILRQYP